MASITIEELSDDLVAELRAAAEHDGRSLAEEIVHLLEAGLRERSKTPPQLDAKAQVTAWRALAGKWVSEVG